MMARTSEQDAIFKEERVIGRKAAKRAEDYLLQVIRAKLNIHNEGNPEDPILKSTKIKYKMGDYRLLGLNLTSSKTGFILNYGFTGVREATTVYLEAARYQKDKTQRKRHNFNLPAQNFFTDDVYGKSGAIDFLIAELSRTRTEATQLRLNDMVLKINSLPDGK